LSPLIVHKQIEAGEENMVILNGNFDIRRTGGVVLRLDDHCSYISSRMLSKLPVMIVTWNWKSNQGDHQFRESARFPLSFCDGDGYMTTDSSDVIACWRNLHIEPYSLQFDKSNGDTTTILFSHIIFNTMGSFRYNPYVKTTGEDLYKQARILITMLNGTTGSIIIADEPVLRNEETLSNFIAAWKKTMEDGRLLSLV
jgi:hypothetical protein